jgi:Mg/Co/Ni transporter MgtE
MMNTEFVSLHQDATVADALQSLKQNEDLLESLNTMFLVDSQERLKASVPLARLFLHEGATRLAALASENLVEVQVGEKQERVTEIFDKYNLLTLPVVDEDGKLAGVITADDVISVLRHR